MKRRRPVRALPLVALLAAFSLGVLVDWALHTYGPPQPADALAEAQLRPLEKPRAQTQTADSMDSRHAPPAAGMRATPPAASDSARADGPVATAGTTRLRVPIDDAKIETFKGGFAERRGDRSHEAVDILAPRHTPVHAVENGKIARLFVSKQGGLTIYQFDPTGNLVYYYAHLDRYADGLREGDVVSQGQVIGYVGTTGNAPPNTPHLHFAVFELTDDRRWWKGRAIDPYQVFKDRG